MGFSSFLKSPKKEEQQEVPGSVFLGSKTEGDYADDRDENNVDIMDDLERILGIGKDEEEDQKLLSGGGHANACQPNWDLMDWRGFRDEEDGEEEESTKCFLEDEGYRSRYNDACNVVKREHVGFWDDDYSTVSLNLSLNYQEVLDAWSDRSLLAHDASSEDPTNASYMGEVPVMEEDKTRREASVMRYKEKRQSRLFSKKIRYQVRKLNADNRPRLKGRFVKRVCDEN